MESGFEKTDVEEQPMMFHEAGHMTNDDANRRQMTRPTGTPPNGPTG
ncbi:hypothetical protein D3OALGA1CA_4628 [Olavius algarvensis associated proteobacterium Delta 3]|nr:hypothetical protein D3OALGB2SA_4816 [Olavius algarvensis associated proteobacterium Delta 3]CAB5154405.1 hypothetical protein D3OALGA1CA_4628 [Olavius algarvensis associated proteobacterium Delta 3]